VPSLPETTERETPREVSLRTRVAPGTTAPVVSVTVPRTSPVVACDCANAGAEERAMTSSPVRRPSAFLTFSSPDQAAACWASRGVVCDGVVEWARWYFRPAREVNGRKGLSLSSSDRGAILPAPKRNSRDASVTFPRRDPVPRRGHGPRD